MSKIHAYNSPANIPVVGGATWTSNEYYSQLVTINADMPLGGGSTITQNPGAASTAIFPLLPLCVTPSVAIFKGQ